MPFFNFGLDKKQSAFGGDKQQQASGSSSHEPFAIDASSSSPSYPPSSASASASASATFTTTDASSLAHDKQHEPKRDTIIDDPTPASVKAKAHCASCGKAYKECICATCSVCLQNNFVSINTFAPTRHHCKLCWRTICSDCRYEQRKISTLRNGVGTLGYSCVRCAVPRALCFVLVQQQQHDGGDGMVNSLWSQEGVAASTDLSSSSSPQYDASNKKKHNHNTAKSSFTSSFFPGLFLLADAMSLPSMCPDSEKCGQLSYASRCISCNLPTVSLSPFAGRSLDNFLEEPDTHKRLMKLEQACCCEKMRGCSKSSASASASLAPSRRHRHQQEVDAEAEVEYEQKELNKIMSRVVVPPGVSNTDFEDALLSVVAATNCYEYGDYPHLSLALSALPFAKFLRPVETHRLFSIYEVPSRNLFIVAFPGTHDKHTVVTDMKFARDTVVETSFVNNGVTASGETLNGGSSQLWQYRIHHGFNEAAMKIEHSLSSSRIVSLLKSSSSSNRHHNNNNNNKSTASSVIFTGHSLGGALATLHCLRLLRDLPEVAYETVAAENVHDAGSSSLSSASPSPTTTTTTTSRTRFRIRCVTFGAPQVGNEAFRRRIVGAGLEDHFFNVVHHNDLVPRLATARYTQREAYLSVKEAASAAATSIANSFRSAFSSMREKMGGGSSPATEGDGGKESSPPNITSRRSGFDVPGAAKSYSNATAGEAAGGHLLDEDDADQRVARLVGGASSSSSSSASAPNVFSGSRNNEDDDQRAAAAAALMHKRPFDCVGRYLFIRHDGGATGNNNNNNNNNSSPQLNTASSSRAAATTTAGETNETNDTTTTTTTTQQQQSSVTGDDESTNNNNISKRKDPMFSKTSWWKQKVFVPKDADEAFSLLNVAPPSYTESVTDHLLEGYVRALVLVSCVEA